MSLKNTLPDKLPALQWMSLLRLFWLLILRDATRAGLRTRKEANRKMTIFEEAPGMHGRGSMRLSTERFWMRSARSAYLRQPEQETHGPVVDDREYSQELNVEKQPSNLADDMSFGISTRQNGNGMVLLSSYLYLLITK